MDGGIELLYKKDHPWLSQNSELTDISNEQNTYTANIPRFYLRHQAKMNIACTLARVASL